MIHSHIFSISLFGLSSTSRVIHRNVRIIDFWIISRVDRMIWRWLISFILLWEIMIAKLGLNYTTVRGIVLVNLYLNHKKVFDNRNNVAPIGTFFCNKAYPSLHHTHDVVQYLANKLCVGEISVHNVQRSCLILHDKFMIIDKFTLHLKYSIWQGISYSMGFFSEFYEMKYTLFLIVLLLLQVFSSFHRNVISSAGIKILRPYNCYQSFNIIVPMMMVQVSIIDIDGSSSSEDLCLNEFHLRVYIS